MIEAVDLTVRYGVGPAALDGLSFAVGSGQIYGVLGASGSGKSTLVNVLTGAMKPSSGQVLVDSRDVGTSPGGARESVSFVCQRAGLDPNLRARQNVSFLASVASRRIRWDAREIDAAMRDAGVPERAFERPVRELGRTLEVLLLLAIAALRRTNTIVLDEPTAGVEPRGVSEIQECLQGLQREGKTLLVTSSDVTFVTRVADRVAMLQSGRKIAEHARSELLGRSLTDIYLEYSGDLRESVG